MKNNELSLSKTIQTLRFPLIVGVVLIHADFTVVTMNGIDLMQNNTFPVYQVISRCISQILSRLAVPLFFLISGFLFFNTSEFSLQIYIQKMKKRFHTLLIPYIYWNLVVLFLFFLAQTWVPGYLSGTTKLIQDYTFIDWLRVFWNASGGSPIADQFWFIRDLLVVMLFSPFLYKLIQWLGIYGIIALGIGWFFQSGNSWPGLNIGAFFFFSAGAWFGIRKQEFVYLSNQWIVYTSIGYLVLVGIELLIDSNTLYTLYVHRIGIITGMLCTIALASRNMGRIGTNIFSWLAGSSFFIYAFHEMPLVFIKKIAFRFIAPQTDIALTCLYFLCPLLIIVIGIILYYFLNHYFPRFTKIITGGR